MQLHLEHRVIDPELRRKTLDCIKASVFPTDVKEVLKYSLSVAENLGTFLEQQRIKKEKLLRLAGKIPDESVQTLFGEAFREYELDDDADVEDQDPPVSSAGASQSPASKPEASPNKPRRKAKVSLVSPTRTIESKIGDHESGCECRHCATGKLYTDTPRTSKVIVQARSFEIVCVTQEALRCRSCENTMIAPTPDILRHSAFGLHASFIAELADLKYRLGMPSLRMERKLELEGLVVSDSRQFEALAWAADQVAPLFAEMCRQIANAALISRDDSPHRIHDYQVKARKLKAAGNSSQRVGVFTSCFRATLSGGNRLILVVTDPKHNGEMLSELLGKRSVTEPLVSVSDASSMNFSGVPKNLIKTALCLAHARRKFYDLGRSYPKIAMQFLGIFDQLFLNDRLIADETTDPMLRLRRHQEMSGPLLVQLSNLLALKMHTAPPNSYLADAFRYLHEHWDGLTQFTKVAGVPLSTNDVERDLKKSIRHRKNSMAYKSLRGARVGSVLMSLLLTAEEHGLSPPAYLTYLLTHPEDLWKNPSAFMPWHVAPILSEASNHG